MQKCKENQKNFRISKLDQPATKRTLKMPARGIFRPFESLRFRKEVRPGERGQYQSKTATTKTFNVIFHFGRKIGKRGGEVSRYRHFRRLIIDEEFEAEPN